MEKWKGTKCEFGYIHKQKIFQSLMLLLYVAIGIGLFLIGLFITKTRANIFTVLGILMVLPGAKRVIAIMVMFPHKSLEKERYDEVKAVLTDNAVLLSEYVFTSKDKIMSLDFVIVDGEHVMGIQDAKGKNKEYMQDYLHKGVTAISNSYKVKICNNEAEFLKFYEKMKTSRKQVELTENELKKRDEVVSFLKVLAV